MGLGRLGSWEAWAQVLLVGGRVPLGVHGLTPRPFHALLAQCPPRPSPSPGIPPGSLSPPVGTQETSSVPFLRQARIKKIMQTDEEIGKVAAAVPVIICILLGAGWAEGRGAGLRHSPFLDSP